MKKLIIAIVIVLGLMSCHTREERLAKMRTDVKEKVFDTASMSTAVLYEIEFLLPDSVEEHYFMYGIDEYDVQKHVESKPALFPAHVSFSVSRVSALNKPFRYIPAKKF